MCMCAYMGTYMYIGVSVYKHVYIYICLSLCGTQNETCINVVILKIIVDFKFKYAIKSAIISQITS